MPSDTSKPSATESAKPLSTRKTRAEKPKADKVEKRRSAKPKSEQPKPTKAKSGTKAVKPKSKSAKADKVSEGKKADKASEGKKAEKSRLSWKDMVKECIVAHSEEVRTGVSRTLIKKYISEKYSIEFTNANLALLNRAITTGAEDGVFVLPKGTSGKVKLAPKRKPAAVNENVPAAEENAPAPPKKAPVKKAPAKPKTTTTKKTSTEKSTEKKKTAVKAAATKAKAKTASRPRSKKQVASTAPGSEPESEAAEE